MSTPWTERQLMLGKMRHAKYRTDEQNPEFSENPFVTCFAGYPSEAEAQAALAFEPKPRQIDFHSLSSEVREQFACQIKDIFVPTASHISGLRHTVKLIRNGYRGRNALSPGFMNHLHRVSLKGTPIILPRSGSYLGAPGGKTIIGPTGIGKSSFVNRVVSYVGPEAVLHTKIGGRPCWWPQIPILRISAAGRTTAKQLAIAIAKAVDSYLGEPHYANDTGQSTEYVTRLSSILTSNLVGALIIDDVQLWARVDRRLRLSLLNLLVGVLEESHIPIICVGTMLLKDVLEAHISQAEKLMDEGSIELRPVMDLQDMLDLCTKIWQWRVTDGPSDPPEYFMPEMLGHTAGIRRYVRTYSISLFEQMAIDGVRVPSQRYMRSVADVTLASVKPGVELLNRAYRGMRIDRNALAKYEEYVSSEEYKHRVMVRAAEVQGRAQKRKDNRSHSQRKTGEK